jgi:hypothetical protein
MAGPRFLLYLLAAVWLLGVVSTGLHLLAVPVLLLLLAVHLSYVAALGLAFAVSPRPTVQSILAAVGVAFLTGGGHLLCCSLGWMVFSGASNDGAQIVLATSLGLSPPVILTFAAFRGEELSNLGREGAQLIVGFLIATGIYVAATVVLWQAALMGFIRSCGRIDGRGEAGPPA